MSSESTKPIKLEHGMLVEIDGRVMRVDLVSIMNRFQNFTNGEYCVTAEVDFTGKLTQEDVNRAFGGRSADNRA